MRKVESEPDSATPYRRSNVEMTRTPRTAATYTNVGVMIATSTPQQSQRHMADKGLLEASARYTKATKFRAEQNEDRERGSRLEVTTDQLSFYLRSTTLLDTGEPRVLHLGRARGESFTRKLRLIRPEQASRSGQNSTAKVDMIRSETPKVSSLPPKDCSDHLTFC